MAHALLDALAPEHLAKPDADLMAALIEVNYQLLRTTVGLIGYS